VFGDRIGLARRYHDVLAGKGITWGLLGPREAEKIWSRHLLNSVAIAGLVPMAASVIDVGSGAGLPGIPLAVARADLRVTLLEPLLRRYTFLAETVDELGLGDQVEVVRGRAEDCDDSFDAVVCRAVAPLDRLLNWTVPLFYPAGILVALKGASARAELARARQQLSAMRLDAELVSVRAHPLAEVASAIVVRAAAGSRNR